MRIEKQKRTSPLSPAKWLPAVTTGPLFYCSRLGEDPKVRIATHRVFKLLDRLSMIEYYAVVLGPYETMNAMGSLFRKIYIPAPTLPREDVQVSWFPAASSATIWS